VEIELNPNPIRSGVKRAQNPWISYGHPRARPCVCSWAIAADIAMDRLDDDELCNALGTAPQIQGPRVRLALSCTTFSGEPALPSPRKGLYVLQTPDPVSGAGRCTSRAASHSRPPRDIHSRSDKRHGEPQPWLTQILVWIVCTRRYFTHVFASYLLCQKRGYNSCGMDRVLCKAR
jgi:hypothetical protein